MQVNIEIDTEYDTPDKVRDLIYGLMEEAGDRVFEIDSVIIDGVENFKVGVGFMNDLAMKHIN